MQMFLEQLSQFLKGVAVYYTVQLGRSAMLSVLVILVILVLRMTLCRKAVFLKGLLWALLIPVPFMGKMRFFYETEVGIRLFGWWQKFTFENIWCCYLYLGILVVLAIVVFIKRRKLWSYVKLLKSTKIEDATIYVSDLEITPFVVGVIRPKIVLPEIMVNNFDAKELKTIITHEQVHIKQGHLVLYVLWDIIRIWLWMNPFIFLCTKWFRSDLEDICDKVVIHKENNDYYHYGKVLLHSIRCLKGDEKNTIQTVTFAGSSNFENIKRRITRVSEYKTYRRAFAWSMVSLTALGILGLMVGIYHNSYKRCNEMNVVSIYNMTDGEMVVEADTNALAEAFVCDEDFIYIDISVLDDTISLDAYKDKELFIYTGGWFKLPGIGGGGECVVVKGENLTGDECKLSYDMPEDTIWIKMLKLL